jgi:hypothetical protein
MEIMDKWNRGGIESETIIVDENIWNTYAYSQFLLTQKEIYILFPVYPN